jgi:hypothetical protein
MAFSEREESKTEQIVAEFIERRRPPADVRDQLDIGHRIDGEWHPYDPAGEVDELEEALDVVDEDELCCFWG